MEKKPKYNDEKIEKAVDSLIDSIDKIKGDLHEEKYKEMFSSLEDTVLALNNSDDLVEVKAQIQSEIINPISKGLKLTSRTNTFFGIGGFAIAILSLLFNFAVTNISSNRNFRQLKENYVLLERNLILSNNTLGASWNVMEKQINSNSKRDDKILENIKKAFEYLKEIQDELKVLSDLDSRLRLIPTPGSILDLDKMTGPITDPNYLFTIPETKNED